MSMSGGSDPYVEIQYRNQNKKTKIAKGLIFFTLLFIDSSNWVFIFNDLSNMQMKVVIQHGMKHSILKRNTQNPTMMITSFLSKSWIMTVYQEMISWARLRKYINYYHYTILVSYNYLPINAKFAKFIF